LKREIDVGSDPLTRRDERRAAETMRDLIDRYIDEHDPRLSPNHARDQRESAPVVAEGGGRPKQ
jgi:hypothetical protein